MNSEYFFKENCYITEMHNTPEDPDVSIARVRVKPGATTNWHKLKHTTERYIIRNGEGLVEIGTNDPKVVSTGAVLVIPPNTLQRLCNTGSDDLIFLAVCTPRFIIENYE
ncbi:MAG: cupin domain-containing protein [Bacteroidetes bacterium]|jgi:mannose-6-phosphate isomerase-like protein (cupin superfamily)|nr:cupin domain-containing protein [Bacteroidota bacterium]MBT3749705.1 cupin domain-containing protein [Bacteroidota bacterium]MBT4399295.1 cupin domain-containing protein [Bacteroidota bacterium]MBT4408391.1 cupin domain-containing protein [Bacteroidota bacterium]MBT5425837.1 cupin domain-containing protein [Bacteroidota bacterium]